MSVLKKLRHDNTGATAIEYGLILALVAIASISAMTSLREQVGAMYDTIATEFATANAGAGQ